MSKSLEKINNTIKIAIALMFIIFNIWIYIKGNNIEISIGTACFSIVILSMIFIYERLHKKYMNDIFISLSDMLGTIIDMREIEVFSTTEDTILAKLQFQTIKLTNILKNQSSKIEEEKNEIKSLISDIAHQLKTPLTNLKMYGEFLEDENLTEEERKEFHEIILTSLNRLGFLVESMIKMSRLESGVITLRSEMANLNNTVIMAISNVQKKAEIKGINIEFKELDKVNIIHDKRWISEAIFNILDNAVKYTKENGLVVVTIENYDMFTRIDIKDNGIGIKEEEIPKIFKRFYRGENSGEEEGIGIGLYLAREIITKEDGYIKVKSNNRGSLFSIFLKR